MVISLTKEIFRRTDEALATGEDSSVPSVFSVVHTPNLWRVRKQ